jgi:hypothetical protein
MIVHVRIDAVAPQTTPAIGRKGLFDQRFRIRRAGQIDPAAIEHQRQHIVGDIAVVGEYMRDRLRGAFMDNRHGAVRLYSRQAMAVQQIFLVLAAAG